MLQCTHCNTLQITNKVQTCIAIYCNTLQHTATHCKTLQNTASFQVETVKKDIESKLAPVQQREAEFTGTTATDCNTLHRTATQCNTLQHTATRCNALQHNLTHCSTLQHSATYCNILQRAVVCYRTDSAVQS